MCICDIYIYALYIYYDRQGEVTWEYMEIHKFLIFFGGYEAPKCQARLVETLSYPSVGPQAFAKLHVLLFHVRSEQM